MSGATIRRTAFDTPYPWGKLALALGVALGILGAAVAVMPSSQATKVAAQGSEPSSPAPAPPSPPSGGGGGDAGGGGGAGASSEYLGPLGPPDLTTAGPAEARAIATAYSPPRGEAIEEVLATPSDATWAVVVVGTGGKRDGYLLFHEIDGTWQPMVSGYPELPCYLAAPLSVVHDIGTLMSCATDDVGTNL